MPKYNPNEAWGSKKKIPQYEPKKEPAPAARPSAEEEIEYADEEEPRRSHLLIWAIVIFAAVIGGGILLVWYFRQPTGPKVGITFTKPSQVLVGNEFELDVSPENYSGNILKNATLVVTLPDHVSFVGQSPDQRVMQESLGDLGPGSVTPQHFSLIATGSGGTVQSVAAKLTYNTDAAPNTPFETDGSADLVVGGPAVGLTLTAPSNIYSGQDFQFTATYSNNTSETFDGVTLKIDYPPAFTYTGSSMDPSGAGNNSWDIGTIAPGGTATITVTGSITGPAGASYTMDGTLSGKVQGNTYPLDEEAANLAIGTSPLGLNITVNDASSSYVAQLNGSMSYKITFTNNSDVTFQNLILQAALKGGLFDISSVQTDGSLNSITDTVTWNGATTPALLSLSPGQSGSVALDIQTKGAFPIRLVSDKNYTLDLSAKISSKTVPSGVTASSTVTTTDLENKVGGELVFDAKGYWRDAASGILNKGPYPPRVNQTTQYTIHWIITNYATDMSNVTLSATLQSGTTCTGVIKSNMSTSPSCNSANGQVSWTIPFIPATTGITGPPAEAIFQVENMPAVNQVGRLVTLLSPTTLTATDNFTSSTIALTAPQVTTALPDDTTLSGNISRTVVQ